MPKTKGYSCPLIRGNCIEHRCAWYTHLMGTNKNTGAEMDEWGCAVTWIPLLLVETASMARHTTASVDSLRNTMVRGEDATRQTIMTGFGLLGVASDEPELPLQIEGKSNGGT